MDKAATWLEKTLDYRFADRGLLEQALTHRSASGSSYERLEFLGDAVLNFVISHAVFERRPDAREGDLSRLRAALVKDTTLAAIAAGLGLGEQLQLGSGERKSGGHRRRSILADALEALFGAVYLDGGLPAARSVILGLFDERLAALPDADALKDPKTQLQERLQGEGRHRPLYRVTAITGQQHRRCFEVCCDVPALGLSAAGQGRSRRAAEQDAAGRMLALLDAGGPV